MKKKDVVGVGCTYIVKVSGHLVPVRLTAVSPYGGWVGTNLRTGRDVRIRTAAKLRKPASILDLPNKQARESVAAAPTSGCRS